MDVSARADRSLCPRRQLHRNVSNRRKRGLASSNVRQGGPAGRCDAGIEISSEGQRSGRFALPLVRSLPPGSRSMPRPEDAQLVASTADGGKTDWAPLWPVRPASSGSKVGEACAAVDSDETSAPAASSAGREAATLSEAARPTVAMPRQSARSHPRTARANPLPSMSEAARRNARAHARARSRASSYPSTDGILRTSARVRTTDRIPSLPIIPRGMPASVISGTRSPFNPHRNAYGSNRTRSPSSGCGRSRPTQ